MKGIDSRPATDGASESSTAVKPLDNHRRTPQVVHEQLRQAILSGAVEAGAPISQLKLARELGISRGPLREALRLLEREGLIESEPNHRVRVAGFSVVDLEQLYAMRIALDSLAITLSTPLNSDGDVTAAKSLLATMEEAASREAYEDWVEPHRKFHAVIVAHCDSRLLTTIAQLSDHAERYRHFYTVRTPKAWLNGVVEHRLILDAVEARDAGQAAERLARHYSSVVLGLIATLAPEHDPLAVRLALRMAGCFGATREPV